MSECGISIREVETPLFKVQPKLCSRCLITTAKLPSVEIHPSYILEFLILPPNSALQLRMDSTRMRPEYVIDSCKCLLFFPAYQSAATYIPSFLAHSVNPANTVFQQWFTQTSTNAPPCRLICSSYVHIAFSFASPLKVR